MGTRKNILRTLKMIIVYPKILPGFPEKFPGNPQTSFRFPKMP